MIAYRLRYARIVILETDIEAEDEAAAWKRAWELEDDCRLDIEAVVEKDGSQIVDIQDYYTIWEMTEA